MKKLALLLTMLPLMALADVLSPTYIHRLHRVGYEILPEQDMSRAAIRKPLEALCSQSSVTGWVIMVLAILLGVAIVLIVRKQRMSSNVRIAALMGRLAHFKLILLLVGLGFTGLVIYLGRQIVKERAAAAITVAGSGTVYVDEPGWKYPTELSGEEQTDFNSRLNSLPLRMREMIEVEWRTDLANGSTDHAEAVVLEVLKNDAELRSACIGIPVEVIVSHYFTTEKWYYRGRLAFTHPRSLPCEKVFEKLRQRAESLIGTGEGWNVHSVYDFAFTPSFDRKVSEGLEEAMVNRLRLMDMSDLFAAMKDQCTDCGVDVESVNRLERWILSEAKRSDTLLGKVEHFGGKRECFCRSTLKKRQGGGHETRWTTTSYADCRLLNVFGDKVKVLYNFRRFYLAALEEGFPRDEGLIRVIQDSHILDDVECIMDAMDNKSWRTWSGWEKGCKLVDVFIAEARGVEQVDQRAIHAMAEKLIRRLKEMQNNDGLEP